MSDTEIAMASEPTALTPLQCLEWVAERLAAANVYCGHGTDELWDEAAHLVLYALGLPADANEQMLPQQVTAKQQQSMLALLKRRVEERIPLPYLTQQAWFMQFPFYVDERVLIPRSPFIASLEAAFSPWIADASQVSHILDVGTGSGSLAICCAMVFGRAQVDAVDISPDALAVAAQNVAHYQLHERVRLHQSDGFAALPQGSCYDFIISNPPYVGEDYLAQLPQEYQHEPRIALYAAKDGLAFVQQMLQQAAAYLKPAGLLFVEVGYNQQALQDLYPDLAFTWLSCDAGGEGIFMLNKSQLEDYFSAKD